ncbi:MAG: hypothetical protein GX132_04575 [Erysipelotrichia bacterium]|jgi:hypothetical protein|nr:hypothetical protein [Erysipelotrichia bacterium]
MRNLRKKLFAGLLCFTLLVVSSCDVIEDDPTDIIIFNLPRKNPTFKHIDKVKKFPNIPSNYEFFDYKEKAIELDYLLFSFAENDEAVLPSYIANDMNSWSPIGFWIDQSREPSSYNPLETGYLRRTFGLPSYVGDNRVISSGNEAMTSISAVLGSSYAGIQKDYQKIGSKNHNFVEMTFASYDTGSKLVHNYGLQGQSFWYDIFPQIIFAKLYDLYPNVPYMKEMVINGADQWLESLPYFIMNDEPFYEFVGFNVTLKAPTLLGNHIEPPNGGLAFLFYSAYKITGERKYLEGAKEVLNYLQTYQRNPNYEALTDYAPFVAAILNFEEGTNYDVGKFLDFIFDEDSAFRPGWAVMNGNFGNYPVDGLVGQKDDYAFLMNSLHLATVLAPLVNYDARYASDIGKYILNLTNNAKHFFPQSLSLDHQSMNDYLPFDYKGAIAYEGFRNFYNNQNGYAMGDATAMFSQPSDLSIYSSAFIGGMAALVEETNVEGILKIDLNRTNSYADDIYPAYLFYNPYDEDKIIRLDVGAEKVQVFDTTTNSLAAKNVSGVINLRVPEVGAKVVKILPLKENLTINKNEIYANDIKISQYLPAINFSNLTTRDSLTASSEIYFDIYEYDEDEVEVMTISFGDIVVYEGEKLDKFSYQKSMLPNTDYTLKVEIKTKNNLKDYVSKRVICY